MNGRTLFSLPLAPLMRSIRTAWYRHLEQHYLMSAAHEQKTASEAHKNAAYYQKKAALIRSRQLNR